MTSKERAKLKSIAAAEPALFQVGAAGLTDAVANAVSDALSARELVKISVLRTSELSAREILPMLAAKVGAEPVTSIGNRMILYRKSDKKGARKIEL